MFLFLFYFFLSPNYEGLVWSPNFRSIELEAYDWEAFLSAFVHFAEKNWVSLYCLRVHKSHLSIDFNINLGPIALFIYLKIILL